MKRWCCIIIIFMNCYVLTPDSTLESVITFNEQRSPIADTAVVYTILTDNKLPKTLLNDVVTEWQDGRVYRLDLHDRGITLLSDSIGLLTGLSTLNLSNNNLSSLPNSIVNISAFSIATTIPERESGDKADIIFTNRLSIHHNRLCSLTPEVLAWIDFHFNSNNYLAGDSTQQCGE